MISTTMISTVTFLYLLCTVLYINSVVFRSRTLWKAATYTSWATLALQSAAILLRWVESYRLGHGHAPLSNMYESLVFFSWCIALLYLLWERKLKFQVLGAFAMPFAFLFIAYASLVPGVSSRIDPLIPALQSNWLHAHVITCFLSYALFALSCAMGIMYLLKDRRRQRGLPETSLTALLPPLEALDALAYRAVAIGFPLLTLGVVTGAAWANYAWGSYWSWDPKETWSLITWFVYAVFLHARLAREWRGRRIAVLSIVGFVAVIFTYFGVNYVLSGLHSYA
ncbi:MAG: c-type cytochrome biogenesis protein CcsB [Deltaproteobacteria bacterium]|nr:c-type cytochrome biogenesis protein CcsB [Deltaproteobacteria bacterium]